jgi:pimeloyl-ACP methyl ester carboxylesterase
MMDGDEAPVAPGPPVRFAELSDLRIAHRREGSGGPPLVLLHGFSASQDSWLAVTAPLAERHEVVTFDRPGFGLTRLPDALDDRRRILSPAGEVAVIRELLDVLEIDEAVFIGHSMGGAIAAEIALDIPDRVVGLVLEDAAIGPTFGPRPAAKRLAANRWATMFGPRVMAMTAPRAFRFFLPLIYDDPRRVPPEIREAYRRMVRNRDWSTGLWEMASFHEASDLADRVGGIKVPTLVITGDRDRIAPPEIAYELARTVADSHLVVMPRCGHTPHEEYPREFVAAVRPFLDDLTAR